MSRHECPASVTLAAQTFAESRRERGGALALAVQGGPLDRSLLDAGANVSVVADSARAFFGSGSMTNLADLFDGGEIGGDW